MTLLVGAVPIGEGPGFLLPVFRHYRGGNTDYVQQIGLDGLIDDFVEFLPDEELNPVQERPCVPGEPAVWIFRDDRGQLIIGTQDEIAVHAADLISERLGQYSLAAAELAIFAGLEQQCPDVMRAAYEHLAVASATSADTWRDAVVLLSAARQDVSKAFRSQPGRPLHRLKEMCVITSGRQCRVYVPESLKISDDLLLLTRGRAKLFGIETCVVRVLKAPRHSHPPLTPAWLAVGVGNIANRALCQGPFLRVRARVAGAMQGWICAIGEARQVHPPDDPQQLIAIGGAAASHIRETVDAITDLSGEQSPLRIVQRSQLLVHVINIRPIGFGTPSANRWPVHLLPDPFANVDVIWVVANHRLVRPRRVYQNLAAASFAQRVVRGLAATLTTEGGALTREGYFARAESPIFGVAGLARFEPHVPAAVLIFRALHSMLNPDLAIADGARLVAFFPFPVDLSRIQILVGPATFDVEIRRGRVCRRDVVLLAIGATLRRGSHAFRDFCTELLAGYGWRPRSSSDDSILFEDEGEPLEVFLAHSRSRLKRLIARPNDQSQTLILTDQSISFEVEVTASQNGWDLIHYSDLPEWLLARFGQSVGERFRDIGETGALSVY